MHLLALGALPPPAVGQPQRSAAITPDGGTTPRRSTSTSHHRSGATGASFV
jgi:hypothetical protein